MITQSQVLIYKQRRVKFAMGPGHGSRYEAEGVLLGPDPKNPKKRALVHFDGEKHPSAPLLSCLTVLP